MNKPKLKSYAPNARRDFIQMIRQRADLLGLTKSEVAPAKIEGDYAVIEGRPYPKNYAAHHRKVAETICVEGLESFIERVAYSWFNRIAALRFMEINGFLSHGFRVLSNADQTKNEPEILRHAAEIELAGVDKSKVLEMQLAGSKDAELYKILLIAQCNELNRAMPFLFERVGDETEMLLPDNLLNSDSVIRKMTAAIDEADWAEVEIIGWLYQFYISERKDEVIGKTVKSEDIPAATQLFTPNWIVKYMTQNSLGRLWLENNPHSALAQNMEFYIKPADEVLSSNFSLPAPRFAGAETRSSVNSEPENAPLNPESLKILDPACGSGHILVEAYELLKAIYTERGYVSREIPLLILENNLFGLDIDERAAQMASFALLMKARKDDRRIFEKLSLVSSPSSLAQDKQASEEQRTKDKGQIPNILTIPDSSHIGYTPEQIAELFFSREIQTSNAIPIRDGNFLFDEMQNQPSLMIGGHPNDKGQRTKDEKQISEQNLIDLLELFAQGRTLGSLVRVPHGFGAVVERLAGACEAKRAGGDMNEQVAVKLVAPFVRAAQLLARRYDCVIANPPYMGGKGMNSELKAFAAKNFPDSKSDLFAMFIERNIELTKKDGFLGFMTPFVWMFLSSYEKLRSRLLSSETITSLVRPEYHAFFESAYVPICSFILFNGQSKTKGDFFDLTKFYGADLQPIKLLEAVANPNCDWRFQASNDDFKKISGSPIAYWVSDKVRELFDNNLLLSELVDLKKGLSTGENEIFYRLWHELGFNTIGFKLKNRNEAKDSQLRWFPLNKGGEFRRWYGNHEWVIDWENDGKKLFDRQPSSVIRSPDNYFQAHCSWSKVTSGAFSLRFYPEGFILSDASSATFANDPKKLLYSLGFLNSKLSVPFLSDLSPTLNYEISQVERTPLKRNWEDNFIEVRKIVEETVAIARADWDSFETSWDFTRLPMLDGSEPPALAGGFSRGVDPPANAGGSDKTVAAADCHSIEECWKRWKELTTRRIARMQELETENNRLFINAYGLQDELSPEVPLSQITLARADAEKDVRRLLSYFVGCLMGRYSRDRDGLIYADAAGKGFDISQYRTFAADDDGIVPVTDLEWFEQEAANRFVHFIHCAFRDEGGRMRDENNTEDSDSSFIPDPSSLNLRWIAEQLGAKTNETPVETVRRYFSTAFFKDHLQTYKKRPIYWLFSSGKQKAFECLVYLHRYNESTLPRMRHEYVLPLMSKLVAQIELRDAAIEKAESTSEKTKLAKQKEIYTKKQIELAAFDEKLRHYSDLRIALDLDDGVKVNYGKFGDLLAEVKQVATTKE